MPAPPAKAEISDTYPNPSNAVARSGFGKLWETLFGAGGLLGSTGDAADARTALGLVTGFSVSIGATNYLKFPSWLGGVVLQFGSSVVTTDGTASFSISLPMTFPTSLRSYVLFNGDNAGGAVNKTAIYAKTTSTTSVLSGVAIDTTTGAGLPSTAVRINWVAFGN